MIEFKCAKCSRTLFEFNLFGRLRVNIKCSRSDCKAVNKRTVVVGMRR